MAFSKIKIERYKNPAGVDGWAGYIEPDDRAWILYFKDDGATKFYPERDPLTGAVIEPDAPARRFIIWRHEDPTGVSGCGLVAYGWERVDGRATVRWLGEHRTETVHEGGMISVEAIHGHAGRTSVVDCGPADNVIALPASALGVDGDVVRLSREPRRSGWVLDIDGSPERPADAWALVKAEPAGVWGDGAYVGHDDLVQGELVEGFVIDGRQRLTFETTGGTLLSSTPLGDHNAIETWASDSSNPRVRRDFEWHEVVELLSLRPTHAIVTRLTPSCGGEPAYHEIAIT